MPSPAPPPPLLSASKAFRRMLTCRDGVASLTSSGVNQEKFVGGFGVLRALSSIVGNETPSVDTLTNSGRVLSSSFLSRHNAVQGRSFLGCGDGEEGDMLSKTHEERRVLGYSPEQLFAVVAAVDLYEDFVPWCQRSQVIRHYDDGSFDAELQIGFKFLVESYISHVELKKPNYIKDQFQEPATFTSWWILSSSHHSTARCHPCSSRRWFLVWLVHLVIGAG